MAIRIITICKCCNAIQTIYINTNISDEANEIQKAINSHENYVWVIENNLMTVIVW